jgi:cysteine desulfurase / selenocysteine lyase
VNLEQFRAAFPITQERAYLFSGAITPACDRTEAALQDWVRLWESRPLVAYDACFDQIAELRAAIAALFGIDATRVSIADNTSRASNTAIRLLRCPERANVVFDETTYPSSRYPFMTLTSVTPRVAVREPGETYTDAVVRCIDGDTVAVAVSHVAPLTGVRHALPPLAEAAHRHGAALIVDVAQTAGVVPIDLDAEGVDMAVGTTMKWLLGPPGVGFLCVRSEYLKDTPGLDTGYMALKVEGERYPQATLPSFWPDSRRLELGMPSLPVLMPAVAGIRLLLEVGLETIDRQVTGLVTQCVEGLAELGIPVRTPADPAERAGVIGFELPEAFELAAYLAEAGVDIGGYDFGLGRIDPHGFNTVEDIDRCLTGIREFASRG